MNATQGENALASDMPTLPSFLRNQMLDIGNGNISGTVVSTRG